MFHSAILIHFDVDIFQMEVLDFRNQGIQLTLLETVVAPEMLKAAPLSTSS